jgi:membrane complex biogenesis BtpA family protein
MEEANDPAAVPPAHDADDAKPIVGMIHVGALPGTPRHALPLPEIVEAARAEARLYCEGGVNCLMIENMHDVPYLNGSVGPEIVAAMTLVAVAIRADVDLPLGIQILAGADIEALAVAHAAGLDFVRVECFSFAHVADEGFMQSNAARLLRYRRQIGAEDVQIWADIKKKHASHALTADLTIGDAAEAAEFMGAETVIVTGLSTGKPPSMADVAEARARCEAPVFVGSGVTLENVAEFLKVCDGVIIGSHFKVDGHWANAVDVGRVRALLVASGHAASPPAAEPAGAISPEPAATPAPTLPEPAPIPAGWEEL